MQSFLLHLLLDADHFREDGAFDDQAVDGGSADIERFFARHFDIGGSGCRFHGTDVDGDGVIFQYVAHSNVGG